MSLLLQETRSPGHMTTITFIDGKQVDETDGETEREGLLGSNDFLVFLSRAIEPRLPGKLGGPPPRRPLTSPCWRRLIVARCGFVYCRQSERGMDNIRVIPGGLFCLVEKQLRFHFYESRIYRRAEAPTPLVEMGEIQLSISLQEEIRWIFWQWRLYSAVSNVR